MIAPGPPVIASVCRTTLPSSTRSRPAASARRCASVAAVNATKCIRLRASLNFVPAPIGPAWVTSDPMRVERGAGRGERLVRAADHDRQRSVGRAHRAAADGRVHHHDPVTRGGVRQCRGSLRSHRRVDDDRLAVTTRAEDLAEHVAHLVVVAHHHADDVGLLREGGHAGRRAGAGPLQLGERVGRDVVHRELDALGGREPQRHRLADVAEPDETDPGAHARKVCPPSTAMICPVTHEDSSESRKRQAPTMSSG